LKSLRANVPHRKSRKKGESARKERLDRGRRGGGGGPALLDCKVKEKAF